MASTGDTWYEDLQSDRSWASLWGNYVRCGCGGIRSVEGVCPVCGANPSAQDRFVTYDSDGVAIQIPAVFMGAEARYEDWVYLHMIEQEWRRPMVTDGYESIPKAHRPSSRAIVLLVFWSYFETRIERLFRETAKAVPKRVMDFLLERHSSIGARMDRLYKVVFSTTYAADLDGLGYANIWRLLCDAQHCRNKFAHGHPEAIDDDLIDRLVANLKEEHESWIAVFNKRVKVARE